MSGLFGTLDMGNRALQAQMKGLEITGHNLANVNNPGYARQRLEVASVYQTNPTQPSQGSGIHITGINQIRDHLLDAQIYSEKSVTGFLQAKKEGLDYLEAGMGNLIDLIGEGSDAANGASGINKLLGELTQNLHEVANNPASRSARQAFVDSADALAKQLQGLDKQLNELESQLDAQTLTEAEEINNQLQQLAELNLAIQKVERGGSQRANDLRDQRVELLEKLSEKLSINVSTQEDGRLLLRHQATVLVSGEDLVNTIAFETNDNNEITLSWTNDANAFNPAEGRLGGLADLKSGVLSDTRFETNDLANGLMSLLNEAHEAGFAADGSTGRALFTGEDAAGIEVNTAILNNPSLLQVASRPDEPGNNENIRAMIQALNTPSAALGSRTFAEAQIDLTTQLGRSIRQTERALQDQQAVESLMIQQRESISGVSIDEEMTELVKYQRAFQASAKLIGIIDEMIGSVITLSR